MPLPDSSNDPRQPDDVGTHPLVRPRGTRARAQARAACVRRLTCRRGRSVPFGAMFSILDSLASSNCSTAGAERLRRRGYGGPRVADDEPVLRRALVRDGPAGGLLLYARQWRQCEQSRQRARRACAGARRGVAQASVRLRISTSQTSAYFPQAYALNTHVKYALLGFACVFCGLCCQMHSRTGRAAGVCIRVLHLVLANTRAMQVRADARER